MSAQGQEARAERRNRVAFLDSAPPRSRRDDSGPALPGPPSRSGGTAVGDFGGNPAAPFTRASEVPRTSRPATLCFRTSTRTTKHSTVVCSGQLSWGELLYCRSLKTHLAAGQELNFQRVPVHAPSTSIRTSRLGLLGQVPESASPYNLDWKSANGIAPGGL